jgi:hypothetical protein
MTVVNNFHTTMMEIFQNNDSRPSMNNSNNTNNPNDINNSQIGISDIIQTPLFVLVIILACVHVMIILTRKTLRSRKFTWLTINVCLANTFFACIQLLSMTLRLTNVSEAVVSCRFKSFIINMATCSIMYSHCVASLNRLLTVRYPQKSLFRSYRWLLSSIGVWWIIGILVDLPHLFFDGFACSTVTFGQFLRIYNICFSLIIPITIVTICNVAIFRYAHQSTRRVHSSTNNHTSNRDMRLYKIMLLTFCVFTIGWAPLFFEQLFVTNTSDIPTSVTTLLQILPPSSLLADMILLIYSDQPVCKLILNAFKCHKIIPRIIKS